MRHGGDELFVPQHTHTHTNKQTRKHARVWAEVCARLSGCRAVPEVAMMGYTGNGESLFSVLSAGSHLRPHCGSTNTRLTCHLGLTVPEGPKVHASHLQSFGGFHRARPHWRVLRCCCCCLNRFGLVTSGASGRRASV